MMAFVLCGCDGGSASSEQPAVDNPTAGDTTPEHPPEEQSAEAHPAGEQPEGAHPDMQAQPEHPAGHSEP
jgi:hypothetical protein